jgi:hypothetical protein
MAGVTFRIHTAANERYKWSVLSELILNRLTIEDTSTIRESEIKKNILKSNKELFLFVFWFVGLLALRPLLDYCASLG